MATPSSGSLCWLVPCAARGKHSQCYMLRLYSLEMNMIISRVYNN